MEIKILCLITTPESGNLDRASMDCLGAAAALQEQCNASIVLGVIGKAPAVGLEKLGAERYLLVDDPAVALPRYATDIAAARQLVEISQPNMVLAPANARIQRFISGLATRLNALVDTHVTQVEVDEGKVIATRWFYRQRMESRFSRSADKLWLLSMESGCAPALEPGPFPSFETIPLSPVETRTTVVGIEASSGGDQTIRPDADLLFVAGAGWTKKQKDQGVKSDKAAALILDFINRKKASLGSSKSMVDLSSEGQTVLPFLTHLHQVGQTGSTPRHAKGLATCCHGEEPHAVGWRFIKERRAINTDANCGWAHGKADVLYVADAFEVMEKVNAML